ncbi:MAG: NADP-dependent methylenetetrahydromethanopterin/methylenetetrahydrofolate dehydrogenase [Gammaproteobacteria bacterium]
MKKLLIQLDTDLHPAVFDTVVAYDGGADHVVGHGGCTPENVRALVEGSIFTRAPKEKKFTAIFVGGSDMVAGQKLFKAVQKVFFADFRVSVMLDSNGSNTTAAAGVAKLLSSGKVAGKKAVILAGTGPVGRRAAVMLAEEGAEVVLTSRNAERSVEACQDIKTRFNVDVSPFAAPDMESRGRAIEGAHIVFACGAAGAQLLGANHWQFSPTLELLADANATPPLGIVGMDMMDKGKERNGKTCWGAIGFGTLKLALHRACISKLFESNDVVLDAEEIFALAKTMS